MFKVIGLLLIPLMLIGIGWKVFPIREKDRILYDALLQKQQS